MRGFALTDALTGLAIISLILVILVSRGPDLQTAEADRRVRATLIDAAQVALVLSQGQTQTGQWLLYDQGATGIVPSDRFQTFQETMAAVPVSEYQLTLSVRAAGEQQYVSEVVLRGDSQITYQQEVPWFDRPDF